MNQTIWCLVYFHQEQMILYCTLLSDTWRKIFLRSSLESRATSHHEYGRTYCPGDNNCLHLFRACCTCSHGSSRRSKSQNFFWNSTHAACLYITWKMAGTCCQGRNACGILYWGVIIDRIRSMREGYIFTGVCHSVHRGWGVLWGWPGGVWPGVGGRHPHPKTQAIREYGQWAVGTHPKGMHSCSAFCFHKGNYRI